MHAWNALIQNVIYEAYKCALWFLLQGKTRGNTVGISDKFYQNHQIIYF